MTNLKPIEEPKQQTNNIKPIEEPQQVQQPKPGEKNIQNLPTWSIEPPVSIKRN